MKVLLTGLHGQLGQALAASVPAPVELIATSRDQLDLADAAACRRAVAEHRPDWVLNAGAYTAVDRAESEPELAMAVNGGAPAAFAEALQDSGGRLLQVSTDFVFDGSQGFPYQPDQAIQPLGVYGATKAEGERAALALPGARVLRTSWVYGPVGRNFCLTMLALHARRAEAGVELAVVADQIGCPTATHTLAQACWRALDAPDDTPRILHWSDAGAASWYDFAMAIGELGVSQGLLQRAAVMRPITTADYPTPAKRPANSRLDGTKLAAVHGLTLPPWPASLEACLDRLLTANPDAERLTA